ncbi:hypothetical protein RUM44_005736 [Polyplax serrata]|uniref:protein geranylgeranyltransferase type II n=1 Tax=Polyplax serrata TaxID=468196 RepID=A0ABR1AWI4_POLSC
MTTINKDVILTDQEPKTLLLAKHIQYISSYDTNKDEYEYVMTEYLRMSGMYWGLTALDLMGTLEKMDKEQIIKYVVDCQDECGGLCPSPGHDPHLLYTLSGIQILCLFDAVDHLNLDKIVEYIQKLQQSDGSFSGDKWGEIDTRFSFCAVAALSLIGRMDAIDVNKAVEFVLSCMNFDGGFGSQPGSESHAGLIYCCIGFLSITNNLHLVNADLLGWWLCERQLNSGGLNGRPEKLPDVCYSWWVLSSLTILGRLHWIEKEALVRFVLACQDNENGGFSDRPGDLPDPFHTLFGIAALSLLGEDSLKQVNPTYCMPQNVIDKLGLKPQKLTIALDELMWRLPGGGVLRCSMVTRLHRVLGLNQALLGNSFQTRNSVSTKSSHGKGKVVDGKAKVREVCQSVLTELRNEGLLKNERVITSKQGTHIDVRGQNGKILNFCANNYLGLADNSEVIEAAKEALDKYGSGVASVRFICGTQQLHKDLELKISKFHNREDTILYPSCFDANAGIFEALLTPEDAILSDELNHASIIDGVRLCKAEKIRYKHRDMTDLELKLKSMKDSRLKVIVTDGVFSMDGNVAPLPKIIKLAQKYGAITIVDECHATGFFGKTGRGTEEYFNVMGKIDIINSTLGKALGGASGGYTTGPREIISLLRQKSRPYLFSNSLPPAVVGAASKVFDIIMKDSQYQDRIIENTEMFREGMTKHRFRVAGDNHPICPIMIGDAKIAAQFADNLLTRGIYVVSFNYPVVPKNQARIRVQISAAHTKEDIERTIDAFVEVGKKLGVIPGDSSKKAQSL